MSIGTLEFLIPGDLQAATGGYGYDRRIIAGLRALGWRVRVHMLDASFPQPTPAALNQAHDLLTCLPDQALVLVDGLGAGAMPEVLHSHASRLQLIALVHHPLAAESGLAVPVAQALAHSERRSLQAMRHILVTSHATQRALRSYGVSPERVSVINPGTDAVRPVRIPRGGALKMLCVAALIPRKGHDLLFEALAPLPRNWHLTCAGSLTRSPATVERLREQLLGYGLEGHVVLAGEVDAATLAQLYEEADLFVLPTRLEGYGMAVAEALAHGLPVVSTHVGAIAELVGTRAGLLVAPEDAHLLRTALVRVLSEPALLASLAAGAAAVSGTLPDWQQACRQMARTLEAVGNAATAPASHPST